MSLSRWRRRRSRATSASVGSSLALLVVKARRYLARVVGLTGKSTKKSCSSRAETIGPWRELEADGDGRTGEAFAKLVGPGLDGRGPVLDDRAARALSDAGDAEADVVLLVGPVDADEGGEFGRVLPACDLLQLGLGSGHAEPRPAKAIWRAGEAAFPECSFRAKAHPRARS